MNNFCSSLNINKLQKRIGRGLNPYHLFMKKDALSKKQIMTIYQYWNSEWYIFHAAPDTAYVYHFFPPGIYNMIQIKSIATKQVDFKTLSFAQSLRDLMHWSTDFDHFYELMRGQLVESLEWKKGSGHQVEERTLIWGGWELVC